MPRSAFAIFVVLLIGAISMTAVACGGGDDDDDDNDDESGDADGTDLGWTDIPEGTFVMGCSLGDGMCYGKAGEGEFPAHKVTISAFRMMATEVTQTQFADVMGYNPSFFADCAACPVEQVSWDEAAAFCEEVGGRLPSEAEWEYVARAGTKTRFPCGDDTECLGSIAWYYVNADQRTHPVASKLPNDFGVYDMIGNVWEWVGDWYDDFYYLYSPGANPRGPENGTARVLRGGGWTQTSQFDCLRSSNRFHYEPYIWNAFHGFRCAQDLP
ncbi:MAG: formylglycine-generating enzyme family protein [Deltaproteobacteria bacterium]|nr:formylglycine-generating enzyme family protein [Deltaproteobacteria bacterium]